MLELIEKIDAQARDNPAKPAVCGKSNIVTYMNLTDSIANICAILEQNGVKRGSKVYLNIIGTDLRLAAMLASLHYGIVPFIISTPDEVPGEVDYDLVVSAAGKLAPEISGDIEIDGSVFEGMHSDIRSWGAFERAPDDLMAVGVTSGSTGIPKLLAVTYRQFVNRAALRRAFDNVGRTMLTYGSASIAPFEMINLILSSGSTIVRSDLNPVTSLRLINLFLADRLVTSPKTVEALMAAMEQTGIKCPSIESIMMAGSLFQSDMLPEMERMFDADILVGYGASEPGPIARAKISSKTYKPGYVGEIFTPLDLQTIANEETGQTQFRLRNDPDHVLRPYQGGAAVEDTSDYYSIPDIGEIEGNSVYILGRADEVYNLSGTKYAFSELAEFVRSIDNVEDAVVVRDPEDPDPFGIHIAIVRQDPVDFFEVMDLLCRRLNRRTARKHIRLYDVPDFPRNAAGKIDRRGLLVQLKTIPSVSS